MIIPKHLFADYIGAKSRDAPTNLKPVGTGPYKFMDFKPGDMVPARSTRTTTWPNRPLFRHHRDEGRRRCRLGGARRAADRRVRLRLEHAGRGRDPGAAGEGRQGTHRHLARAAASSTCSSTRPTLDRGRRRAREPQDQASDPVRSGGAPGAGPAGRPGSIEKHIYGRTGEATANYINNPEQFRSKNTKYEFNVDKANELLDKAGWKKGSDGIRAKDGKKLKFVFQTSINQPRQKTQAIIKQACQKAGIDIEIKSVTASVYFSSDVANPDTYPQFYCDLQMYNTGSRSRIRVCSWAVCSWEVATKENKWQGRNMTRWPTRSPTRPTTRRRSNSIRSSARPSS